MTFKQISKVELYPWLNYLSRTFRETMPPKEKKFLGEIRVGVLYNCSMVVIEDDQVEGHPILSLISYTITKRYLNIYFMYTTPGFRGIGLNNAILDYVMKNHAADIDRIYVITSTLDSVAFYFNKGFKFWGLDKHRCLVAEFDITATEQPRKSAKVCQELYLGEPLNDERIVDELTMNQNPNYNHSVKELMAKKIL
jgi:hypothetical protein